MKKKYIQTKLQSILPLHMIYSNEPMYKHTSFRIGGPATFLVTPTNTTQILQVIELCKKEDISFFVMGNGSNLLVSDDGYEGIMIKLTKNFSDIKIEENNIIAASGALLSRIATIALSHELTGFEFAHGIPGTIGGAVTMNAGAYDGEMKDVITSATILDKYHHIRKLTTEDLQLGYRTSAIQKEDGIVLEATMALKKGQKDIIAERMKVLAGKRKEKQPLEFASAGSTFKRPKGHFAGKLIMDAGLRGYRIGGAVVSPKHCGFIINDGTATCKDVLALIDYIQHTVWEKFQVKLEPEVKIIH